MELSWKKRINFLSVFFYEQSIAKKNKKEIPEKTNLTTK